MQVIEDDLIYGGDAAAVRVREPGEFLDLTGRRWRTDVARRCSRSSVL